MLLEMAPIPMIGTSRIRSARIFEGLRRWSDKPKSLFPPKQPPAAPHGRPTLRESSGVFVNVATTSPCCGFRVQGKPSSDACSPRRAMLRAGAGAPLALRAPVHSAGPNQNIPTRPTLAPPSHRRFMNTYGATFQNSRPDGDQTCLRYSGLPDLQPTQDLELSTQGSTYDVIIVAFIYQDRWIGAGWNSSRSLTPG